MRKFVIISDSCCDLDNNLRKEYDIDYVPMYFNLDGKEYKADLDWKEISVKQFYDAMREGKRAYTAQANLQSYKDAFTKYVEDGYDVLSISCSSGLSASVKASYVARDAVLSEYPEAKIICIDGLNSCFGLGILCLYASDLRKEGKSIDEVAQTIEDMKLCVNQECSVDKLTYLKQAGRVSAASAFFGGLLNIKPIIISDAIGQNFAVEKVKGRKTAINRLVERMKEEYEDVPYQKIMIGHSDCIADALELKKLVLENVKSDIDINIGYIGPIVGASCGPGTIAVYFIGKKVEVTKGC